MPIQSGGQAGTTLVGPAATAGGPSVGGAGGSVAPLLSGCGDGQISADERCDIAIPAGTPGSCPTSCGSPDRCLKAVLTGTACSSMCTLTPILSCTSSDECCPVGCTTANDSDCSAACGDGIVQTSQGETCEPAENVPAGMRCPNAADCDDHDACTADTLTGSAMNCNAACVHTPITAAKGGDGCCPSGANNNTDADCPAKCGNGVRESGEDCDGTTACSTTCKLTVTTGQLACLGTATTQSCAGCECTNCLDQTNACMHSGDAARDAACTAIEACAVAHRCVGQACYCGTTLPMLTCWLLANGPCIKEIEDAAGTPSPSEIDMQYRDPNTAIGRAAALGACRVSQCASACTP